MASSTQEDFFFEVFPFYAKLSPTERALLLDHGRPLRFAAGETVHAGDGRCTGPLLLRRGRVRAYLLSEEGREITLYRLFVGDFCPLSAPCLLGDVTLDVTLEAECDAEATVFEPGAFAALCRQCPAAESYMLRAANRRLSEMVRAFRGIVFESLDCRLASFLLGELERRGGDTVPLTQEEISRYTGSARETISRRLKALGEDGVITVLRGGVRVRDLDALRALSLGK